MSAPGQSVCVCVSVCVIDYDRVGVGNVVIGYHGGPGCPTDLTRAYSPLHGTQQRRRPAAGKLLDGQPSALQSHGCIQACVIKGFPPLSR